MSTKRDVFYAIKFWTNKLLEYCPIFLISCLLFGGCATDLKVTYQSDPPGASLYQNSQLMGYTPMVLYYPVNDTDQKNGIKYVTGTSVKWASGASSSISSLSADLKKFGLNQVFTFSRPDIPGRYIDMQVALKFEELAIRRQQTKVLQDQAFYQYLQTVKPAPQQTTNCSSMLVGNTVQTRCY